MIVRLGLVVVASIVAYAVKQINVKSPNSSSKKSGNGEELPEQRGYGGDEKEQLVYSTNGLKEVVDEEEEKEKVKLINGITNPAQGNQLDLDDPEFEGFLFSGEIEFLLPSDKYDTGREEREKVYQTEMANNANELERLRNLVKELEEREVKLEGELLEYYGLKEQESNILELQKQLKIKTVEIDMLNITINTLQAEKQKLQEELFHGATARKDLEAARSKIKELQRQMQLEANQTKAQLLLLKQHVTGLQEKEEEAFKRDSEVDKKLKLVKELEVEVMELKRKNKELQHEKRELVIKLDAAESKIAKLSNMTEICFCCFSCSLIPSILTNGGAKILNLWVRNLEKIVYWVLESQGEFVESLATEVRAASLTNIEDLVAFVNWLDEELSFLLLTNELSSSTFDWPEGKADALRETAFEYQDLMKLEKQVTTFVDDPNLQCDAALKKMYRLLEKVEQSVYALLRTRDMAASRYREFGIPTDWLQDSGVVGKIKFSSVQLARKYMKRVASELDALDGPEKEPNREFLILQGVRFAFRVHQFAGGFDAESMKAFEELRSRVRSQIGGESTQEP
ncbi:hypothetical protein P3S67_030331 [Capsicum chacoense]